VPTSPELHLFVQEHVRSLEHLEILLLLMQYPDRWWDANAVAQAVGVASESARQALDHFAARNLLAIAVTGAVRYRFQPGHDALRAAADAFGEACRTNRLAVLRLVTKQSPRGVRDFADAFRIRRDDDR
jgi:hypothetical protein